MTLSYQPIIIIGAARSGTKLVRDLIAQHPEVDKVPFDVNYIWRLGNESLLHDELPAASLTPEIRGLIRGELARFHHGAPSLVEKTVGNCLRVPFVGAVFPEAKFIHLLRDGFDVVESAYRQWQARPDWRYILKKAATYPLAEAPGYAWSYAGATLRRFLVRDPGQIASWGPRYKGIDKDLKSVDLLAVCARQWQRCVDRSLRDLAPIPAGWVLTVRYEDFVQRPRSYLLQVASLVHISSDPYQDMDLSQVTATAVGKGRRTLTDGQKALIAPLIESTQTRLEDSSQILVSH